MKNLITKAVAVAGLTLTLAGAASGVVGDAPVVGVPAASAHAPCSGATHYDWHVVGFHNDRHYEIARNTVWHNHWWSGSNHPHTHVTFATGHGNTAFNIYC